MREAPDTREFRIYFNPGQLNALLGHTLSVTAVSEIESEIETDIPDIHPANSFAGARLRVGSDVFEIVANEASTPLRVHVKSGPVISGGSISAEHGSTTVTGSGTTWDKTITGCTLKLAGEPTEYTILKVENSSLQELTLDRAYAGPTGSDKAYTITGKLPRPKAPCTLVIPSHYTAGRVSLINGSADVTGVGTGWRTELTGWTFKIVGESAKYTIVAIASDTQLTLDQG